MPDKTPGGTKPKEETSAPATIQVSLPANAKLFVDGVATQSTSATRTLVTPELPAGQQFSYTLKAQTVVNAYLRPACRPATPPGPSTSRRSP